MNNIFIYVLICMVTVAFSSFSMYSGSKNSASDFALGTILLAALAVPFVSFISSISKFDFSTDGFSSGDYSSSIASDSVEEAFCKGIKFAVSEKFSLNSEQIEVECDMADYKALKAEKIRITLSGKAAYADFHAIEEYIEEQKLGECEVILNFG